MSIINIRIGEQRVEIYFSRNAASASITLNHDNQGKKKKAA